jgi:hypothetical protein
MQDVTFCENVVFPSLGVHLARVLIVAVEGEKSRNDDWEWFPGNIGLTQRELNKITGHIEPFLFSLLAFVEICGETSVRVSHQGRRIYLHSL